MRYRLCLHSKKLRKCFIFIDILVELALKLCFIGRKVCPGVIQRYVCCSHIVFVFHTNVHDQSETGMKIGWPPFMYCFFSANQKYQFQFQFIQPPYI